MTAVTAFLGDQDHGQEREEGLADCLVLLGVPQECGTGLCLGVAHMFSHDMAWGLTSHGWQSCGMIMTCHKLCMALHGNLIV